MKSNALGLNDSSEMVMLSEHLLLYSRTLLLLPGEIHLLKWGSARTSCLNLFTHLYAWRRVLCKQSGSFDLRYFFGFLLCTFTVDLPLHSLPSALDILWFSTSHKSNLICSSLTAIVYCTESARNNYCPSQYFSVLGVGLLYLYCIIVCRTYGFLKISIPYSDTNSN